MPSMLNLFNMFVMKREKYNIALLILYNEKDESLWSSHCVCDMLDMLNMLDMLKGSTATYGHHKK